MDQIKDTPVDRQALDIMLRAFPDTRGVDPTRAGIEVLNDLWSRMAAALARMSDNELKAAKQAAWPAPSTSQAVIGRISEMFELAAAKP